MFSRLIHLSLRGITLGAIIIALGGVWNLASATQIYTKAWVADLLLKDAWQKTLNGEHHVRPWPWADTWPVAELVIPKLGIRQIVLSGDSGRVLAFSSGYTEASALPGQKGQTLISGHRDTHFKFLKDLKNGDRVELKTSDGLKHVYIVGEQMVVDQRYFRLNTPPKFNENQLDNERVSHNSLVLATCYPFDALQAGGDQRYLVVAHRNGY